MASRNLLLVEGIADKSFFEEFCRIHTLDAEIRIAPAKEVGGTHNSKRGAIDLLPTLLQQLESVDGPIQRLAMVVDADAVANGGGFDRTITQIAPHLVNVGYTPTPVLLSTGGLVFEHPDGLPAFGLWVMPDNVSDGILEDWIAGSIHPDEQTLFAHATAVVGGLPSPKFNALHRRKSEVATWLAWQKKPGEGIYYTVQQDGLLNPGSTLYAGLRDWLIRIFRT